MKSFKLAKRINMNLKFKKIITENLIKREKTINFRRNDISRKHTHTYYY